MEEAITDLKRCIKEYRAVDDDIRIMNKMLYEKRETRKIVEMEMADIVKMSAFDAYKTFKIEDDGSVIKIQRPQMYSKPWSLSKKDLQTVLDSYFASGKSLNAKDCFDFICADRKNKLVANEFSFTRVLPQEEDS
jgi:hypothetical protein